jgi:hypothetical protein
MSRLRIPESLRAAMAGIVSMGHEAFETLVDSLRNVTPSSTPASFISIVEARDAGSPSGIDLAGLVSALFALYRIRDENEVALPEFVDDLGDSMSSTPRRPPVDLQVFKQRTAILLDIPSLAISAKAYSIYREQPKIFVSARIFSDIRPVFSQDAESLRAATVLHQLKISYVEEDERHDLFLALDSDDLAILQKVITRAQAKAKVLAGLIEKTDLMNLG